MFRVCVFWSHGFRQEPSCLAFVASGTAFPACCWGSYPDVRLRRSLSSPCLCSNETQRQKWWEHVWFGLIWFIFLSLSPHLLLTWNLRLDPGWTFECQSRSSQCFVGIYMGFARKCDYWTHTSGPCIPKRWFKNWVSFSRVSQKPSQSQHTHITRFLTP